jgi:putative flippase GtrA
MRIDGREILRFGCVGLAATLTHFAVLSLGVERLGLPPALANGLAFAVAVGVTWAGQSAWVFRGHGRSGPGLAARFAVSLAAGFLGNVAIMFLVTRIIGLHYRVGFVIALIVVPAGSYLLNRRWVFRKARA